MVARPKGATQRYAERLLGGVVVPYVDNPTTVAGVKNLLPPSSELVFMHLTNLSDTTIYMGFNESVSSTNGFLLSANGGYISLNVTEDFDLLTLPIYIQCATANKQMYLVYTRRETEVMEG